MATNFKNVVTKEIGTQRVTVYESPNSTKATIIGMSIANITKSIVHASVLIGDAGSSEAFFVKDMPVAPGSTLKPIGKGEKIVLNANNTILIQSDTTDSLDVIVSLVEIV